MSKNGISVGKEFIFHAAHKDETAEDKCGRLHGHTYRLEVEVHGELLAGHSMLIHGDVLKEIYREKIEPLVEHRYLNETCPYNPTMELVLMWIADILAAELRSVQEVTGLYVKLWETPTMYAETIRRTW